MSRVRRHLRAFKTAVKFYRRSLAAQRHRDEWVRKHGERSVVFHDVHDD